MWTVLSSKYGAPNVLLSSLSDKETAISCLMEQVAVGDKLMHCSPHWSHLSCRQDAF